MQFCEKVKYVRGELLLTQEQLAQKLEVSFATINRWEQGNTIPKFLKQKVFYNFCTKSGIKFED